MEPILVYITVADRAEADKIAAALVNEKLAACANICDGVNSLFHWQGRIDSAQETLCVLKSVRGKFAALNKRVLELHSYDTPCVVALPIIDGNPDFMAWIAESCA
ncbi:divalent-cation tolerance protein CutA [Desulfovibrio sp. OttesenSCG-928-C06]|nr:divalent-cation tolerance protein CutA [Desulfovibrio sp. OttesenSCG-928-C06]